jgi:hypothetical protein
MNVSWRAYGGRWRQRFAIVALVSVIAILAGCAGREPVSEYTKLFPDPEEIADVEARSAITEYKDAGLYEFLDGGAEIYFDYGIVAAASAEYRTGPELGIEVTLYDMGGAEGAYGIYSTFRYEGADFVTVGTEGIKTEASLDFWKGRFYCRVLSFDTAPEARTVLLELAEAVAAAIPDGTGPPALVELLPEAGKIAGTEKYFRQHLGLNNIQYVASENVLNLSETTEGTVAEYLFGDQRVRGFIIRYVSDDEAGGALDSYREFLSGKAAVEPGKGSFKAVLENGNMVFVVHERMYIIGIWDAMDEATDYTFVKNALASIGGEPQ